MKDTTPCVSSGSLWDPNITVETLEAHQLRLSFTPWNESTSYQVLLHSFPPAENQSCFQHVVDMPVPQPGRVLCLLPLAGPSPPRSASQIQPFFSSCLNDCLRHSVSVACPEVSHTPGGTRGCQGPRGSRVGEGQQPRLHHDLVGGEGAVVQACVVQP
uniref:Uncharacterized protein n=1 Tax=Capra hircus TaxID=9925 RepID=A0A8C2SFY9_CAPHI